MKAVKAILLISFIGLTVANPAGNLRDELPILVDKETGQVLAGEVGNANLYIDLVLYNINSKLPSELPLGDIGTIYNLHECFALGLDSGLHRDGDATLITSGNIMKFVFAVQINDIIIKCGWKYLLMNGNVVGTEPNAAISMGITFTIDHGEHPELTEFRITNLDYIEIDITGVLLFNWLIEDIVEKTANSMKDEVTYVIEVIISNYVQKALDKLTLP